MTRGKKAMPGAPEAGPKKRGRPPKQAGQGHNSGDLTDDQRHALFLQHVKKYKVALADKKAADAEFRNVSKKAKAELGEHANQMIKDAILIEDEAGSKRFQAEMVERGNVARWMNLPVGWQDDMFEPDRRPAEEREFDEGRKAGLAGEAGKPPERFGAGREWLRGHADGQDVLMRGIKQKPANDETPAVH